MKTKIGVLVVSALMLVAIVPIMSAMPKEAIVPQVTAGPYEEAYGKYIENLQAFQAANNDWLGARATFLDARLGWRQNRTQANLANLLAKSKTALLKADDMMIKRLQLLRVRVEISRGLSDDEKTAFHAEIDNYIGWLQGKRPEIEAAENEQVVRSISTTIWNYWSDVRVRIRYIVGQILSAQAEALAQKANAFAGRIEARIQQLKDNGVDTSTLEAMLADCNSNLALAEQKYDAAKEKFDQISSPSNADVLFAEGVTLIREGNGYIREAFNGLRDIISEIRSMGRTVTLSGSGSLVAHGSGSAYISGTGLVKIENIQNGTMVVSSNAHVNTDGTGENLENGDVKYVGFSWARVTGENITVSISGENIVLHVAGRGTVTLTGTGTYWTSGENRYVHGTWTATGATADLATGDVSAGVA
ncbi:MAG: hypothetical protein MUO36_04770 [Candidatus Hadarchaeum sp.]|jgi:hypothetical protein|nr:hypothetical protein [Candidatus Hadarchaeum sp.]